MKKNIPVAVLAGFLAIVPFSVFASGFSEMPGPKDDLYKILWPSYADGIQKAEGCDSRRDFKVDLHSSHDLKGYRPGQVFGAQVCGRMNYNYDEVRKIFPSARSVVPALSKVDTFSEVKVLTENQDGIYAQFEILVPMMENYLVKGWITFESHADYSILHWYQQDSSSRLLNNRGFMVIVPEGVGQIKVFLSGYHILKPEFRLRFPFSSFAPKFTHDHYGNYFKAFESHVRDNQSVYPFTR